jgi:hypothetical protein
MGSIATVRNHYNLDPFLPIVAPSLFGANDNYLPSEHDSLWPLLMRGMFGFLYRDLIDNQVDRESRKRIKLGHTKTVITVTLKEWAFAYNTITKTLVTAGRFKHPQPVNRKAARGVWQPPLRLAGPGSAKILTYKKGSVEPGKTKRIIELMQGVCLQIRGKLPADYRDGVPGLNES